MMQVTTQACILPSNTWGVHKASRSDVSFCSQLSLIVS